MKLTVRITLDDGRTAVVRRGFDSTPSQASAYALVDECAAQLNLGLAKPEAPKKKVAKKKAAKSPTA